MAVFLNSIQSVLLLGVLTFVGYYCAAKGWLTASAKAFLSKFLMNFAMPCTCLYSIRSRFTREQLAEAGILLVIPLFTVGLSLVIGFAIGKLLKLPRRRLGLFANMAGISNTLFIGYPMCTELFGADAAPYVMAYYMISTSFTQTAGMALIRWSGGKDSDESIFKSLLKVLTGPMFLGLFAGILLVLLDINPPHLIMSSANYLGQTATTLGLIVTGQVIHSIGLKNLKIDRDLLMMMGCRFLISPALCIAVCALLGIGGIARGVAVVQAAMPTLTSSVYASTEYGADEQFAAQGAAVTTLATFVVIPALMLLLQVI